MLIIPAIDLRAGQCVRLVEGKPDMETVYSDEPAKVARAWEKSGSGYLHVVDLDGAFTGSPKNMEVISDIIKSVNIPIQVGGGIREMETVENLVNLGVSRVILGTAAIVNPELVEEGCKEYGENIVVGIDARNGKVAIEGWGLTAEKMAVDLALEMCEKGVKRIIFTDIWRDGTLKGPNFNAISEIAKSTSMKVIASGGISTLEDVSALKKMENLGVEGVIMGKSLYAGTVNLEEALAIARGDKTCIC
ncbi:MAG: 1-(5-phosphoribosyl)-5-[(5-phosphoribosylamino)methylideneamino]imidazole-4-carboxamide isomerase [Clostridiales bacterium]|nr:1-(5-phosphoribosyl)-5-[(5-phosphoribosylamino)methylideneamino]imidazole-4-carboxamide isomerase [Clostridiales bacterium]MCF8021676.1 1-(5-phosphoribosyl)-5-[(5-phosphoribosylamino)methylideneamino]imidazole-4-carboxamide isomerase [Clostridiales bacterium]